MYSHLSPDWPRVRDARVREARREGRIANACGQWSRLNPIRHVECRNLPLDRCKRHGR